MEVSINALRWFIGIAGPLVLMSYVVGIKRADDPMQLWGNIGPTERAIIVPFMFLAAAGFLTAAYLLLWKWNPATVAGLHWPGGASDGQGGSRLLLAYALYLIPSMLWLESTLLHLRFGAVWTQVLTIGVLTLVSVGLLLLGLLSFAAIKDGVAGAGWLLAAVVCMALQSTLNDNIIWVAKFPWR